MQYVAVVLAFNIGKSFRKPMGSNTAFIINVVFAAIYILYIILIPDPWNRTVFGVRVCSNSS